MRPKRLLLKKSREESETRWLSSDRVLSEICLLCLERWNIPLDLEGGTNRLFFSQAKTRIVCRIQISEDFCSAFQVTNVRMIGTWLPSVGRPIVFLVLRLIWFLDTCQADLKINLRPRTVPSYFLTPQPPGFESRFFCPSCCTES